MSMSIATTKKGSSPPYSAYIGVASSLLSSYQTEELAALTSGRKRQNYSKGQIIYREGNPCAGIYCVEQGKVKVSKFSSDGKEQIVRLAKRGDVLGICSLLTDTDYTNSAIALDDCVVRLLPRQEVLEQMQINAQFATVLMRLLAKALNEADERLLNLAAKPVRERLAGALVLLQHTFREANEALFTISIARDDLASIVGTVKETVSRLVSEFKEEGLIATKGSKITILQEQRLVEISTLY